MSKPSNFLKIIAPLSKSLGAKKPGSRSLVISINAISVVSSANFLNSGRAKEDSTEICGRLACGSNSRNTSLNTAISPKLASALPAFILNKSDLASETNDSLRNSSNDLNTFILIFKVFELVERHERV